MVIVWLELICSMAHKQSAKRMIITLCAVLFQANIPQSTYSGRGLCENYKSGQYCDKWLNSNETVFVDNNFSQADANNFVNLLMSFALKGNFMCRQFFDQAICRYVYPNCTTNGVSIEVAQLCADSCPRIEPCTNYILEVAFDIAATIPTFLVDYQASHIRLSELQYSCRYGQRPITLPLPTPGPGISCLDLGEDYSTPSTVDSVLTCGGTGNNSHCSFPFTYNGIDYKECTLVNSFDRWRPWCVTEKGDVGEDDKWGYCDCDEEEAAVSMNATCEVYSGGPVCEPYLNSSVVFVDNQYRQEFLENLVNQFSRSFHESSKDQVCAVLSLQILCHLLFPACLQNASFVNSSVPLLLCHNSCSLHSSGNCGLQFRDNMKTVTNYFQGHELNPVHFYAGASICQRLPKEGINFTENCIEVLPRTTNGSVSPTSSTDSNSNNTIIIAVIVSVLPASIVFITLLCLWRRKTRKNPRFPVEKEKTVASELVWDDDVAQAIPKCLVDEKRLELKEQIGEGNFGKVYKGILDGKTTVAAKCLKADSRETFDRQAANSFIREALRMKDLDHPNVMKLIGICWGKKIICNESEQQILCGPLIVLPYTEMSDLRGYLRGKRRLASSSTDSYVNVPNDDTQSRETPVPVDLLLKFSYQIGKGMDYISQRGIVHRDLAARNCMLTWDMKVKVSDFGLARVLEEGKDYYRMEHNFALPVRWMALESIIDFLFTTESDVWSYGVTLWEIFSLCTMPYAGLSNQEVLSYVQRGQRLEKPDGCPDDIYEVIRRCWMAESNARPTFPEIISAIEKHLSDGISYLEMQEDSGCEDEQ